MFKPPVGPCYNCLYPKNFDYEKKVIGILGVLPGLIGLLQAQEAIKLILGIGENLVGWLLIYDALALSFDIISFAPVPDCPVCGRYPIVGQLL